MPQMQREGLGDPGPGLRRLWWLPLEDLVLGAMAKVQTIGLLEVKTKTRSRPLSPSWTAWSRTWRSSPGRRATHLLWPLRNLSLVTFSPGSISRGWGSKSHASAEADAAGHWTIYVTIWGLWSSCSLGVKCSTEVTTANQGGHHLEQTFHHPCVERLMEGTRLASSHCSMKVTGHHGCVLVDLWKKTVLTK